jgi:hypothetical protein
MFVSARAAHARSFFIGFQGLNLVRSSSRTVDEGGTRAARILQQTFIGPHKVGCDSSGALYKTCHQRKRVC